MARGEVAPFPYTISLGGVGYMLAHDGKGNDAFTERAPQAQEPAGEQSKVLHDWSGGIGAHRNYGDPLYDHVLATTSAAAGGGVDSAFGPLIPGPKLTTTAVGSSGEKVRKIVGPFNSLYWAGIDAKLYKSSNPDMSAPTLFETLASNIRDLTVYQGTNTAGGGLLFIAQQYGALRTTNGTAATAADAGRAKTIQALLKTPGAGAGSGVTYTDYTNSGTIDLSALPALGGGGWVVIGMDRPFVQATFTIVAANAVATTLAAHYWNGSAWTAVTGLIDGTAAAGASMAATGAITWNRPAAAWTKTVLTDLGAAGTANVQPTAAYYWVRLSWNAALTNPTTATFATGCLYYQEAEALCVVGNRLNITWDRNKIAYTTDGGSTPTWNESADPIGSYVGQVVGMAAGNNTPFLLRTTDFGANNADGTSTSYLPDLFHPPASGTDDQGLCSGLNLIFLAHDYSFYQFDPISGASQPIGPERIFLNDDQMVRVTACVFDRTHALYAAVYRDATGESWIYRWGGYRKQPSPESGTVENIPLDAWFPICYLGGTSGAPVKVHSIVTWTHTATGITYLALGDNNGRVLSVRLPTEMSPINDQNYLYSIITAYAHLPVYMGADPSQPITPFAWMVQAKNLDANRTVTLETRAPGQSSWVAQGTADNTNFANGGARVTFSTLTAAAGVGSYGIEMRLKLVNNSTTAPPMVEAFGLFYEQPARQKVLYEATVWADDYMVDLRGRVLNQTATDWLAALDAAAASRQPLALVRQGYASQNVLVRDKRVTYRQLSPKQARRRAVTLTLADAS